MSRSSVGWGILGCGDVSEVKSGPAFRKCHGSKLVAVMRRTPELAESYANRHGVPRWYSETQALIQDPEVDIVYIATPVGSHCDLALAVAAAGKPAYVEKPMARNATESARMVEAFRAAGLPLYVAYYRRALPRFLRLRALVEEGTLGTITSIRYHYGSPSHRKARDPAPWRLDAGESGGGLFMDLGCHALDILDFVFGPLLKVAGEARNVASPDHVEDTVAMHFEVGNGTLGVASWCFAEPRRTDRLEICGTRGTATLAVFGQDPIFVSIDDTTEGIEVANPEHIQQPLVQNIVDELRGLGHCPSTGESALRTSRVMDMVLSSYYNGRDDAFWERPQTWPGRRV